MRSLLLPLFLQLLSASLSLCTQSPSSLAAKVSNTLSLCCHSAVTSSTPLSATHFHPFDTSTGMLAVLDHSSHPEVFIPASSPCPPPVSGSRASLYLGSTSIIKRLPQFMYFLLRSRHQRLRLCPLYLFHISVILFINPD